MNKQPLYIQLLVTTSLFSLLLIFPLFYFQESNKSLSDQEWSLQETLGTASDDDLFQKAETPVNFQFPKDHGGHRQFRNEWWYWVGHLRTREGREFGYQWTIFRTSLFPQDSAQAQSSPWQSQSMYMGHFAVSDMQENKFYSFERFSRESLGLAGVQIQPFQLWLEDWKLAENPKKPLQWTLQVQQQGLALNLHFQMDTQLILQGRQGLSQKGSQLGNASYYYSLPRVQTQGTVSIQEETFEVVGESWQDREWSTSSLEKGLEGWDWFAIQLASGENIMVYLLRKRDQSKSRWSSGIFIRNQQTQSLTAEDFQIDVLETWTSPKTNKTYPSGWLLKIPKEQLTLTIMPKMKHQEHLFQFHYWEGAADVQGTLQDQDTTGNAYVELVGY